MPTAVEVQTDPAPQGMGLFLFAEKGEKDYEKNLCELSVSDERSEWAVKI